MKITFNASFSKIGQKVDWMSYSQQYVGVCVGMVRWALEDLVLSHNLDMSRSFLAGFQENVCESGQTTWPLQ